MQAVLARPPLQLLEGKPAIPISSFLGKVVISAAEESRVMGYYSLTEDIERGSQLGYGLRSDFSANLRSDEIEVKLTGSLRPDCEIPRQQKEVCQSPLLYLIKPNEELAAGTPEQQISTFTRLSTI